MFNVEPRIPTQNEIIANCRVEDYDRPVKEPENNLENRSIKQRNRWIIRCLKNILQQNKESNTNQNPQEREQEPEEQVQKRAKKVAYVMVKGSGLQIEESCFVIYQAFLNK